ncbi:hypothetical protein CKO28_00350 [Rhodovibrio sodomensis]|uniref:Glyoxalase-related protein domain-containing protein n=1 Tax=Rhodovibrio sodomensis TaxID=1088 RepID=A0ABS1D809_9PROT|nr:glyoxalase superfamily protein [Rhodovibrio sodomensis]MBK1666490.1 hypothetical protein [Rhodovibrio sodomensis]
MNIQIDLPRLKEMARTLQHAVAETPKQRFRYTQALDALARALGWADYNTAEAKLQEAASGPIETTASAGSAPAGKVYLLKATHDYTTDTVVCTTYDAVLTQIQQLLFELDTATSEQEVAEQLTEDGSLEIDDTTIELEQVQVVGASAPDLSVSAERMVARMESLLRTEGLDERLSPYDAELTVNAYAQLARDVVARHPDRAELLQWLIDHRSPAPWKLVEHRTHEDQPESLQIRDAENGLIEDLGTQPSNEALAHAASLIEAVRGLRDQRASDLPAGTTEVINAFRKAGGTAETLFRVLNSNHDVDAANDASTELEIDGIDCAFACLVEQMGVIASIDFLLKTLATLDHRSLDRVQLAQPAIDLMIRQAVAQLGDEDRLTEALDDLVYDQVSEMAANAANSVEDDAAADEAVERTWQLASSVNNQGPSGQLAFLVEHWGLNEVQRALSEATGA